MNDTYAVFAALSDGTAVRLTLPTEDNHAAIAEWTRLDDLRRAGHVIATKRGRPVATAPVGRPLDAQPATDAVYVRHFVVRSMDDPQWNRAEAHMGSLFLLSTRDYAKVDNAGRAFARASSGRFEGSAGGWIRNASGQPLVQGWFQFATAYAGIARVNGAYRYTVERFHADWTLGRQGVTV